MEHPKLESKHGSFELHFQPLVEVDGSGYAFPCDANGHVDMNGLDLRSRNNYLYARAVVGLKFWRPTVRAYPTRI